MTTNPSNPNPPSAGAQPTNRHDDWGHDNWGNGSGDEFGGHSSKKQASQKSSWSDYPTYPSGPSYPNQGHPYPSYPNDPSDPHGPGYPQLPPYSHDPTGAGNPTPYARSGNRRATHASTSTTTNPSGALNSNGTTLTAGEGGTTPTSEAATVAHRTIGESCSNSQGSGEICLALKYVSYVDGYGDDVESERDAVRDVEYANQIWRDCGIQFQLEEFQSVEPREYDLRYQTRNYEELNEIRGTFSEPGKLLVVATGKWDRSGSLGNTWANAWTNLPGERTYGVVLERTVTSYPQILAHELGHYLSLDHKNDPSSLMNPVVGRNSVELSRQECKEARWAARSYWLEMIR